MSFFNKNPKKKTIDPNAVQYGYYSYSKKISLGVVSVNPFAQIPDNKVVKVREIHNKSTADYEFSLEEDFEGRTGLIEGILRKKSIPNLKARVIMVLDDSSTMTRDINADIITEIMERSIPLALKLGNDEGLGVFKATYFCEELPTARLDNTQNYAKAYFKSGGCLTGTGSSRVIGFGQEEFPSRLLEKVSSMEEYDKLQDRINSSLKAVGITDTALIIDTITKKFGENEPSELPTLVLFFTDGYMIIEGVANALVRASRYNIFFQFIGLGDIEKDNLKELDNLPVGNIGRLVDNTGYFGMKHIEEMSEKAFYKKILDKFPDWIEDFNANPQTIKPVNIKNVL